MKKQSNIMKLWEVIYPIFLYFVVTVLVLFMLESILPESVETMLLRQLITSLVVGLFLWWWFFYKEDGVNGKQISKNKINAKSVLTSCIIGGSFAIAWNNLLGLTGIANYSEGYSQVEETFYTGRLLLEIVALCIVIPIVEELLYRGIVYIRIRNWLGVKSAILLSAVIFGLVHMNLVQFVYATVFGLLLAYIAEKTGNFYASAIAHMVANFTSVLRAETSVLAFMDKNMIVMLIVTIVLLILTVGSLWWLKSE